MRTPDPTDRVDHTLEKWARGRPDLDFSAVEVVARVLRAAHLLQARTDRIAAAFGLSHTGDLEVLTRLDLEGPLTPTELADALLLTAGGMTVRLNRLQAAGLLGRHPNPRDGRGVLVRLTPAGKALADDALHTLLEAQTSSVSSLGLAEREGLAALLRSLLTTLGDVPALRGDVAANRPA